MEEAELLSAHAILIIFLGISVCAINIFVFTCTFLRSSKKGKKYRHREVCYCVRYSPPISSYISKERAREIIHKDQVTTLARPLAVAIGTLPTDEPANPLPPLDWPAPPPPPEDDI